MTRVSILGHRGQRSELTKQKRNSEFFVRHGYEKKPLQRIVSQLNVSGVQIRQVTNKVLGTKEYRQTFRLQVGHCVNCGWQDTPDILETHHRDGNRRNNCRENLIVLCPNCHRLVHKGYVKIPQDNSQEYVV